MLQPAYVNMNHLAQKNSQVGLDGVEDSALHAQSHQVPQPYLQLKNIRRQFDSQYVLKGIDLELKAGELVCFLGPSGCGKTTLLRAIAGLDMNYLGVIVQNGVDVSRVPAQKRDFGIVFQSYALFPNLNAEQNIAYGLRRLSKISRQTRVDELLTMVGLSEHRKKLPSQLSGGQQQRVALARALAPSPGLLLLDEPLSALDAQVREHLRGEIRRIQKTLGITTIMVTHDQDEAMAMADRIVLMNNGVIEQCGTPEDLYRTPRTPFAAQFLGLSNLVSLNDGGVLASGHALSTNTRSILGEHCLLRPEQWCVSDDPAKGLPAIVTTREFLGNCIRLQLKMENGYEILAEISSQATTLIHAEKLYVGLPEDHLVMLSA